MTANQGLILHHAIANGSLYNWFNSPASGVSATFWVSQDGTIEQYVDSEIVAWHAMQMNDTYCGVETDGCSDPPYADPMSDAMVEALARLYAEGHQRHGWPYVLAERDGQPGFGYHRMGVATACPCDIRLNMRAEILTLAQHGTPPDNLEADNVTAYFVDNTHHVYAQRDDGTVDHWWLDTGARPLTWAHETLPKG
jgi:hypothetical protein